MRSIGANDTVRRSVLAVLVPTRTGRRYKYGLPGSEGGQHPERWLRRMQHALAFPREFVEAKRSAAGAISPASSQAKEREHHTNCTGKRCEKIAGRKDAHM